MALQVVVLAAGKGTRMRSHQPKVLQKIAGTPLLTHVLSAAFALSPKKVHVIVGFQAESVIDHYKDHPKAPLLNWVKQTEQLGTGHAVKQALPDLSPEDDVLVLYGDVPLLKAETLYKLIDLLQNDNGLSLLTVEVADSTGYGRIKRDTQGGLQAIIEHKDASESERDILEINSGIMAIKGPLLQKLALLINNNNAQQEYYLTDLVELVVADSVKAVALKIDDEDEVLGVNDRRQLAYLERAYMRQQAEALLDQGVTLKDPSRFDCRGELSVGQDVEIDINVIIENKVVIGDGATIGANCILKDCVIQAGASILPFSMIDSSVVGESATVGPYARIRPGCELGKGAKAGNFVELKNTKLSAGAKANHLTYLGDAEIGTGANVGAGTITCNYDGVNKSKTMVHAGAFVGSNSSLVAPVTIGENATIGAGSTVTRDVSADTLAIARSRQETVPGWQRPLKKDKK